MIFSWLDPRVPSKHFFEVLKLYREYILQPNIGLQFKLPRHGYFKIQDGGPNWEKIFEFCIIGGPEGRVKRESLFISNPTFKL